MSGIDLPESYVIFYLLKLDGILVRVNFMNMTNGD